MEIERKYLIQKLPEDLDSFPFRELEQGYLCTDPVIRIRRDDDRYELTYKSGGLWSVKNTISLLQRKLTAIFCPRWTVG